MSESTNPVHLGRMVGVTTEVSRTWSYFHFWGCWLVLACLLVFLLHSLLPKTLLHFSSVLLWAFMTVLSASVCGWGGFQGLPWDFPLPLGRVKLGRVLCVQWLQGADVQFSHCKQKFLAFPLPRKSTLHSQLLSTAKGAFSNSAELLSCPFLPLLCFM